MKEKEQETERRRERENDRPGERDNRVQMFKDFTHERDCNRN